MKLATKVAITGVVTMTTISAIALAQVNPTKDLISNLLRPEQEKQCGLHKLSAAERASLTRVFSLLLSSSRLGESAVEYLKNEGWDEVRVLGERRLRLDEDSEPEEYVIAEEGAWTYILEPKTFSSLSPGVYMGRMSFASCEIINTDGELIDFWTADTR